MCSHEDLLISFTWGILRMATQIKKIIDLDDIFTFSYMITKKLLCMTYTLLYTIII